MPILNPSIETVFYTTATFPLTGVPNILYVNTDTAAQYIWNGTTFIQTVANATANAAGNKGDVQFRGNTVGSFAADTNFNWDTNKTSLQIGSAPATSVADALVTAAKSVNNFTQVIIQNTANGNNSTADLVAMNNLGTDLNYYVDLGINSSTYSDPAYPLSLANDGYLYVEDGNFTFGTDSVGKYIIFHTGGFGLANERIRIIDGVLPKDALVQLSSHLRLVNDTTANRPTTPLNGMIRYNTTTNRFEGYENGVWKDIIGEINTGSNLGTGAAVFKQKVGVNFEYRTLTSGAGIALNETANEIQIINTVTGTSAVIAYYFLNSQTPFTTSSTTDILVAGMTNTPAAGTYHIKFNADLLITQNGKRATFTIYRGGVAIADSVRSTLAHGNNDDSTINTFTVATFNGTQTMEIRVRTDSSSITIRNRAVFLEKLV